MTTKFTPGPWTLGTSKVAVWGGDSVVADAWESNDRPDYECEANANLIAAAPEMYEALNVFLQLPHLFDDVCDRGTDCKVCKAILLGTAALAKADGGQ